ncbi:MAG: bifunctional UDP-N-acetylglucosamine diphosphorylase/glucosamine-1-phosphate N-acetyltransferase GlmU [Clostridia bacterium]|nr:bifunctional UDP-N-acetylglucosamine diphosphorylase/glucosamine-1-phosphate N-acetyltransferase GlmU [Clostridia bacterium]
MNKTTAIVLAAGEGKRMHSRHPKVLSKLLFRPMIQRVIDSVHGAGIDDIILIIGFKGEELDAIYRERYSCIYQKEQKGTGHAVMQAKDELLKSNCENVIVLNGDAPFVDSKSIVNLIKIHEKEKSAVTLLSAKLDDPFGYGRIIRDSNGNLEKIVEQKDADEEQQKIKEVNSGVYVFNKADLLFALDNIQNNNAANEYYLTDTTEILKNKSKKTGVYMTNNPDTVLGANDKYQLFQLNEKKRLEVLKQLMLDGVEIPCIDGVIIEDSVVIEAGTTILPGSILKGQTKIGKDCVIGPNSYTENVIIGDEVIFNSSYAYDCEIKSKADIGPFVRIRPDSIIEEKVHIGNFVEVKNSTVGAGTKLPHFNYIGDCEVGKDCNFGCGSLVVNYDGTNKTRSTIGDNAFIGCNTNLVSPIKVGHFAYTAAGSTITDDVPDYSLAIARNRQENKENWVIKTRKLKNLDR